MPSMSARSSSAVASLLVARSFASLSEQIAVLRVRRHSRQGVLVGVSSIQERADKPSELVMSTLVALLRTTLLLIYVQAPMCTIRCHEFTSILSGRSS